MVNTKYLVVAAVAATAACLSSDRVTRKGFEMKINSKASCLTCSVAFEQIATLRGVSVGGFPTSIARDSSNGNLYIVDATDRLIKAFGSDGQFLRTIGLRGGGPGEYEMIRNLLATPGGTVQIVDPVLGRRTTFGLDGAYVSSAPIYLPPGLNNPAILWADGQLLANSPVLISTDTISTLQLVSPDGSVIRSMDTIRAAPNQWWRVGRLLWKRSDGSLLVADPYSPKIAEYGDDLHLRRQIPLSSDSPLLGGPTERPSDGVFDRPFTPRLLAMWEDSEGLLWLVTQAPSPAWQPKPPNPKLSGAAYDEYGDRPRIVTVFDVIDLRRAELVFRSEIDGPIGLVFGQGLLAKPDEESVGEQVVNIQRIKLKR